MTTQTQMASTGLVTCFDVLNPPLYLGGVTATQPDLTDQRRRVQKRAQQAQVQPQPTTRDLERLYRTLQIGTIFNLSVDSLALRDHRAWYEECELDLFELPLKDEPGIEVDLTVFDQILAIYRKARHSFVDFDGQKKPLTCLVHCTMGVNRSALACGAILWAETLAQSQTRPRPWETPEEMITWMRKCQQRDRGEELLINPSLEQSLITWCQAYQTKGSKK